MPRFSLVSAAYNVARYLPDFIASLEAQTFGLDDVEIIVVDDGSTDETPRLLAEWAARQPSVTVVTQDNAGQGAARNAGIKVATGEWISFPDPDDTFGPDYLGAVDTYVREHPEAVLASVYRFLHFDEDGRIEDTHPLRKMFGPDTRTVDLDAEEKYFPASAPCVFFRRETVVDGDVRFDPRIRPNFEDGHFVVQYLLAAPSRVVGYVTRSVYNYRKRSDGSSTLNGSLLDQRRYTVVPEIGYLDAIARARAHYGHVPTWLQTDLLYELSWYFGAEEAASGSATAAHGEVGTTFVRHLREIAQHLDERLVLTFNTRGLSVVARHVLLSLRSDNWRTPYVVNSATDDAQRLTRISYRFTGDEPTPRFTRRGRTLKPVHSKLVAHTYFGQVMLRERIHWLPGRLGTVTELDGQLQTVLDAWPTGPTYRAPRVDLLPPDEVQTPWRSRTINRIARTRAVRRLYGKAWVLMDRTQDADDSGELLFRHLRAHKRSINAWFVIEKGTPDHRRLRAEGYKRVVPYGSWRWKLLMANAAHLISSHADKPVVNPAALEGITRDWRFTFLQHGVIKDDISAWLNPKPIDLFVTSTTAEHAYIAGDDSPFRYTTREVRLTELPRFDRLHAAGTTITEAEQNLLLVAPTWRSWLVRELKGDSQRRDGFDDSVLGSEYVREWDAFLRSANVARLAQEHGLTITFMPHPNMQPLLTRMNLPAHVQTLGYVGTDIAGTFARAAVLVTDYSSVAFNAAYMDRPVLYHQFDAEAMFHGGHVGRAGYFDYERDGFGPVVGDLAAAEAQLAATLAAGRRTAGLYAERVRATFPLRDGEACARVVAAIQALTKRQDR